jgi:plastocyanin
MKNGTMWGVLVLGGWYYLSTQNTEETAANNEEVAGVNQENQFIDDSKDSAIDTTDGVTVTYSDTGFSPKTLTVKKGTTVTFVDQNAGGMWVGSDEHPSHTGYDGTSKNDHCVDGASTSFDQCGATTSYSFTFNKVGTWPYHNHTNASDRGVVIVTE